jgi:hypothetical protein
MREVEVGTKEIRAIWTKEMHEDLIKQECFPFDLEKHLVSVLRAEKRKNIISKVFKSVN